MMNMHLLNRSGLAAIAAATALIATPVLAQDATPVAAEPAPIVADAPLPSEPAATPDVTSEPAAAAPVEAPVAAAKTVARANRAAPAAPKLVRTAAPVATVTTKAVAAPAAAPTAMVEAPADPAMVAPIPEPVAPVAAAPVAANNDDLLPIAGAAGLGILALAGAGFAMRRRRRDDDVVAEQDWVEPAPAVAAPAIVEPVATAPISAFAWGDKPAAPAPIAAPTGLSRIEAAKRGPTPDNPSASLKKRLARAAFFDQRERAVAAGTAVPVSPMAGLPERLTEVAQPARRNAPAFSMGFNRQLQPA